ncbi:MAG: clostripain-related cysteine peptidase [Defluviitaleaceae bacterium]|nr:clostripain-related cysteine peptidase [Defluviitaleaceae bacterium]
MRYIKKLAMFIVVILFFAACTAAASPTTKPYTIMIYMNGSDLESDFGAATTDLIEMLESGLDSRHANIVILTGGTNRWQNDVIPANECVIWEMADGWLYEVDSMGLVNMGEPSTLRDFIKYSMEHFPGNKYGLIMWDHGGGSIAGFGHDEKFNDDALTLRDMKLAFEEAGLRDNKLEFLGFDACLMATVEMAVLAADYAHVMIASEDLEPGDGWDYVFLGALNCDPNMNGFDLGKVIVDTFMDFYGPDSDELLSLSVVDLARVGPVMDTMGRLMGLASGSIKTKESPSFYQLAERRGITKTFGEGSPRDNYSDMVDVGDMAVMLECFFPREAAAVIHALNRCVVYNRHNSDIELFGLSTFYVYGGKSEGVHSLRTYSDLEMDEAYTQYLHHFFNGLVNHKDKSAPNLRSELVLWQPISQNRYRMAGLLQTSEPAHDLLWPRLNDRPVGMYPVATTAHSRLYAVPAQINGREGDIMISFSPHHPQGHVRGVRYNDGYVIQKGYDPIETGDKIALYALEWDFDKDTVEKNWSKSDVFTVTDGIALTWSTAPQGHRLGYRHTDVCHHVEYTLPF